MLVSGKNFIRLIIISVIWLIITSVLIFFSVVNWQLFIALIKEDRILVYLIPYFFGWLMYLLFTLFVFWDNLQKSFIDKDYSLGKKIFGVNW